uniref:Uncharacterized protein n=1 Tax=Rhizophora mucronata TaxID=61149 RepID=A0A2P2R2N2_RHIMU
MPIIYINSKRPILIRRKKLHHTILKHKLKSCIT